MGSSRALARKRLSKPQDPSFKLEGAARSRLEGRRNFIVTSAQNNTPVDGPFWSAIQAFAKERRAQIVVDPIRYKNPTDRLAPQDHDGDVWWPVEVRPFLVESGLRVHPMLTIMAGTRIQATAANPLTGLESRSKGASAIYGHPQICMETVATPQHQLPKILYSTGSCSVKNYSHTKTGAQGEFHHTLGAIVVEVRGELFHVREVTWDGRAFIDLDQRFTGEGVEKAPPALALVTGDEHAMFIAPEVAKATYGPGGIVSRLQPGYLVRHDVLDSYSISHHHNDLTKAIKAEAGMSSLEEEMRMTLHHLYRTTPKGVRTVVVPSNHHDHVTQWLAGDKRHVAAENLRLWHWLNWKVLEGSRMGSGGAIYPEPFEVWARANGREARKRFPESGRVRFLARDMSFSLRGVELGMHGHQGPNGARGTARNLSKIGTRTVVGHSHSPKIFKGVYQVGTSSVLRLEYNSGPSSWLNTHCVLLANGKRQMIHVVNGRWRG